MNEKLEYIPQVLGALIDSSVDAQTIDWIHSLCDQTMIRPASTALTPDNSGLRNFCNRLLVGEIDMLIFLSAAGVSGFLDRALQWNSRSRLVDAICDLRTVASGQPAADTLVAYGIEPSLIISDADHWRRLLIQLEKLIQLDNLRIGLEQATGINGLTAGLEARGVLVHSIESMSFQQGNPSSTEQDIFDAIEDGQLGALLLPNSTCAARFAWLVGRRKHPLLKDNCSRLLILVLNRETEQVLAGHGMRATIAARQT